MYCQKCGIENLNEAKFCKSCGFQIVMERTHQQMIDNLPELEIKTGFANHYKGIEAVGGKLYLTNKRLRFKSHKLNIQVHEMEICLSQIVNIEKVTGFLAFKTIKIHLKDGTAERFVVNDREDWIYKIIAQTKS